jgi:hypothetical protein
LVDIGLFRLIDPEDSEIKRLELVSGMRRKKFAVDSLVHAFGLEPIAMMHTAPVK